MIRFKISTIKFETKRKQVSNSRDYTKMAGVTPSEHNHSLKEALIESLSAILSPDHSTRINGEDQVKALEVTEGNVPET